MTTMSRYTVRQIPGIGIWVIWDNQIDHAVESQLPYTNKANADSAAVECNRLDRTLGMTYQQEMLLDAAKYLLDVITWFVPDTTAHFLVESLRRDLATFTDVQHYGYAGKVVTRDAKR